MNPWVRRVLTAFILVHVYIMVTWGLPGSRFRSNAIRPVDDYVIYSGLWHSWDMFSPEPLSVNFHVEAEVTFADGSKKVWEFPSMEKLGIWEKFQKERYRKWRERVRQDAYNMIWPYTARYIARLHNNPTNPPVQVALIRHWENIRPPLMLANTNRPGTPPKLRDYQPLPNEWPKRHKYRFHQYQVKAEDLE